MYFRVLISIRSPTVKPGIKLSELPLNKVKAEKEDIIDGLSIVESFRHRHLSLAAREKR